MTAAVLYDQDEHVVMMTLNRPEALNAINRQLRQELTDALRHYDQDDTARVAIITGAGRAFCAGRDLKERAADNAAGLQARASDSLGSETLGLFPQTWKPLIAAINGYAMAGGWAIAQMCDLRLAAADAMLGISEARWSLLPPFAAALTKLIAMALGQKLVANAPLSLRNFKELAYRSLDMSESATAALTMRIYDQLLRSADAKEGPRAFTEKRKPQWKGR